MKLPDRTDAGERMTPTYGKRTDTLFISDEWSEKMRKSLVQNRFSVAYQPIIHVSTETIIGVEALARWTDEEGQEISPSFFIPLAEQNGFIYEFTEWMIDRALEESFSFRRNVKGLLLLVNVSPHVLARPSFSEYLDRRVDDSLKERLILEITHQSHEVSHDETFCRTQVVNLMEKGFRFALHDSGVGHLDLKQLALLPAHILKTDVSLIRHPEYGRRGTMMMNLVSEIARELQMLVIAEGVEGPEQWTDVKSFGIEYAKGFFFCPPLMEQQLNEWVNEILLGSRSLFTKSSSDRALHLGQDCFLRENPVLILDSKDPKWIDDFRKRSGKVLINGEIKNGIALLGQFDFLICVIRIDRLTTLHLAFLQHCRRLYPKMPVIVIAENMSISRVVKLMREGVKDVILFPDEAEEVTEKIQTYIDSQELIRRSDHSSEQMMRSLRNRMEWASYKESRNLTTDNRFGQKTIENLRASLTQASGFGILLTLFEMLAQQIPLENGDRIVTDDIMKIADINIRVAQKNIDGLNRIVNLMKENLQLTKFRAEDFQKLLAESLEPLTGLLEKKKVKLNLPVSWDWGEHILEIEPDYFQLAIQELAINAFKYTVSDSEIDFIATTKAGYLCMGFKNIVSGGIFKGISDEVSEIVTEPFQRLHPPFEDEIEMETFGLGLGLTAVKYIMHKHGGMFTFKEVRDHSGERVHPAILSSIYLPVVKPGYNSGSRIGIYPG